MIVRQSAITPPCIHLKRRSIHLSYFFAATQKWLNPLIYGALHKKPNIPRLFKANAEANRVEPDERCLVTANEFTGGTRGRVAYLDTRE
ncbi:protein of unknown function [Pseudomonas inefficax]|uniref:Uncharacterized protein n=1 Tax=Pseudomonas inefficax TaxID=2078786 RepID=A0AAQ1PDL2_9PSED|nr:protein of unknown function [Pseudomonas inefficax]